MIKKLLFATITGFFCLNLSAETTTSVFTYDKGNPGIYGTAKRETMDMAICINNPSLAGMKITEIKAYIGVDDGVSETSVWLSEELTLEKKVNAPDICSIQVPVKEGEYTDAATGDKFFAGEISGKLDNPYTLTGKPVYAGFSMTVDNIDDDYHKYPLILSQVVNNNGFFFHTNKTVLHWSDYSERVGGVLAIYVTLEGESNELELGIMDIDKLYVAENEDFTANVEVSNTGRAAIESIGYTYSYDDSSEKHSGFLKLDNPINPDLNSTADIPLSFTGISGLGEHTLLLSIEEINGQANNSPAKSFTSRLNVAPFVPVHRPLVEEYTGLWCQYCTRGYIGMELISEFYGDEQVSICYHNNDAMMVTSVYPMEVEGYPQASIDRTALIDPYFGSYQDIDFGIRKNLEARMSELALGDISLSATFDEEKIDVVSTTRFITDIDDANYQIGYVLVCNNLSDPTWVQSNAYAGASGFEGTYLEDVANWPKNVTGLVFNDVAVDVSGMGGIEGSVPSEIKMGQEYSHSFSFDINKNSLINDIDNLVVTAFIIDKKTKTIVNANKYYINKENGVEYNQIDNEVVAVEYYDIAGRRIINPDKGIFIRLEKMSNGTVRSAKIRL